MKVWVSVHQYLLIQISKSDQLDYISGKSTFVLERGVTGEVGQKKKSQ